MFRIRRFGVVRTANVVAVVYLILTLIFAIPFMLILAAGPTTMTDSGGRQVQFGLSPLLLLLVPVLYAVIGWIFTALACLLYNLAARFTGGIEVDVTDARPTPAPPAPPASSSPA